MRNLFSIVLATALTLSTTSLWAQESNSTDSDFDIGASVPLSVGDNYVAETFGDWALRCVTAPEGQTDPCNLYQLLVNDDGVAVSEVNFFQLPPGGEVVAGANIVVPLETFLPQALTLGVDGANLRRYPFRFCNRAGCVARVGFTQAEVDEFKAGAVGSVRIVPAAAPETEVVLTVSLSGFTAGFDALTPIAAQ